MRGRQHLRTTALAEVIDYGHAQCRALLGIGAGSHLVKQNQRGRFAQFNHARDICDVRSKSGQVCGERLMVANISKHRSIEWNPGLAGGDRHTRESHQRKQSGGLKNDCLTARVGAGYHHRGVVFV